MAFNLPVTGQTTLLKFFRGFKISGYVDSVHLRGYRLEKNAGVCTFGVKLRGLTGGNIDLEVPMAFDIESGTVREPVLAFIDGRAHLISQGMFNKMLDRLNLEKKWVPGWMSPVREENEFRTIRMNDPNKYKIASQNLGDPDFSEAFEDYNLCLSASFDTLHKAIGLKALDMLVQGFSRKATRQRLAFNFLGATSFTNINVMVDYARSLLRPYLPEEPPLKIGMRKLGQPPDKTWEELEEEERKREEQEEGIPGVEPAMVSPLEPPVTPIELTPEQREEIEEQIITQLPLGLEQQKEFEKVKQPTTEEPVEFIVEQEVQTGPLPIDVRDLGMDVANPNVLDKILGPTSDAWVGIMGPSPDDLEEVISPPPAVPEAMPAPGIVDINSAALTLLKALRLLSFLYYGDRPSIRDSIAPHYLWHTNNGKNILMSVDPNSTTNPNSPWRSFDLSKILEPKVMYNGEEMDLADYVNTEEYKQIAETGQRPVVEGLPHPEDFFKPEEKYYQPNEYVTEQYGARPGYRNEERKTSETTVTGSQLKDLKRFYFRTGSVLRDKVGYLIRLLEEMK
jgi:hypothetical protein